MKTTIFQNQIKSDYLEDKIMSKIQRYENRRNRIRVLAHSTLVLCSCAILIPAFQYLYTSLNGSGFFYFISLIVTDGKYAFSFLNDLIMSIVTSWPIIETVIVIAVITIIINSIRKIIEYRSYLSNSFKPSIS